MTAIRRWLLVAAACLVLVAAPAIPASALSSRPAGPTPEERFQQAAKAYDEGEFETAVEIYRGLIDDGRVSASLLYNLGNALYRAGDPGGAAVHYRRAWGLAPRDPEIRNNLDHVLRDTEAVTPAANPLTGLLFSLSAEEYARLGAAAWWLGAALFIASCFLPALRPFVRRALPPLGAAVAAALLGLGAWSTLRSSERMVTASGQHALYAPLDDAQRFFALPPGSRVRLVDDDPPWIKVQVNGRSGWIRSSATTPTAARFSP